MLRLTNRSFYVEVRPVLQSNDPVIWLVIYSRMSGESMSVALCIEEAKQLRKFLKQAIRQMQDR